MASPQESCTPSALTTSEVELIDRVHSHFQNNEPNKFHFFYRTASPFSNFHLCKFSENDIEFDTSEKYIMYHKAKLFNDNETATSILQVRHPAECKAFGRSVKNFDEKLWVQNRARIFSDGLYLKFTQDDRMKQALLKHEGSLLVEAAKDDCIWGVGLDENNPLIKDRSNWKGLNLLGYVLTDVLYRILDGK
ncbi:unnamed protein product [Rotaria socialis]|uniref:NADAR domain-containing protein n=1 Tax=Rotaria socialis TaxID=392032 RepID=A0A819XTQ2_9BILA|nr:unnamed protein product [Rotaria socialis]CAF3371150.1 unnamed protein product [Rotaria socialis]CAF3395251.1 unnamed protein product [Rotaria socialis]CAF3447443.1 unnamed protein product [Rotaria socialis]CAF3784111.1 unnamed protein product [Rotaria socialis]